MELNRLSDPCPDPVRSDGESNSIDKDDAKDLDSFFEKMPFVAVYNQFFWANLCCDNWAAKQMPTAATSAR